VLNNPSTPGSSTSSQVLALNFTVYDANSNVVTPSSAQPVTVAIYDAPSGSIRTSPGSTGSSPLVITVTSGSTFSLTYAGSYLSRPLTVIATAMLGTTNPCTNSADRAMGSTTIPLETSPTVLGSASYTTPTGCRAGSSGTRCAALNVNRYGLSLKASVGFGAAVPTSSEPAIAAPTRKMARYTVDTGSIGTVLPLAKMGPDAIGPGPMAMKYYDSSGNEFIGFTYLAPVTLSMGGTRAQTIPIRVLAVATSACHASSKCTKPPPFANFYYLGVGFDRSGTEVGAPFASPRDNAFLAVEPPAGSSLSEGYILSGASITTGITAANSQGFSLESLTSSSSVPGDWLAAPVCVSFPSTGDPSPEAVCGDMLLDVGIPQMYITFAAASDKPAAVANGLMANQTITVKSPTATSPVLSYSFSSGPSPGGAAPPTTGMNPAFVGLSVAHGPSTGGATNPVFINTGRHILFENNYLFDAQTGQVGFEPLAVPLR
jgi:hypothetical protein